MIRQSWLAGALLVGGLLIGCKEEPKPSPSGPSTQPAATEPAATQPGTAEPSAPATRPATTELLIDGQPYTFPTARLVVSRANGHVQAQLYSNDPKAALSDDYKLNSYDLLMNLDDIHEPMMISSAQWEYKAPSREYVDTHYGIFLEGLAHQLQPANVQVKFLGTIAEVRVEIEGEFLDFDQSRTAQPARSVFVKGSILAPVELKD